MNDRQVILDKETKAKSSASFWITMMVLLPVLYVLSIGPAAWLAGRYPALEQPLSIFYLPLGVLAEKTGTVEWFQKYIVFWMRP